MKHKIYRILPVMLTGLLSCTLLTGCFKDHSTDPDRPVTEITTTEELREIYTSEEGRILEIPAPKLTLNGPSKEVKYSWEVDYKEVSTSQVLKYRCPKPGVYALRLLITNGETTIAQRAKINVQYRFRQGLYFLGQEDKQATIGFVEPSQPDKEVDYDVLTLNNPAGTFVGTPHDLAFVTNVAYQVKGFILACGTTLYNFEPDQMIMTKTLPLKSEITSVEGTWADSKGRFFYNGRFGDFNIKTLEANNSDLNTFGTPLGTSRDKLSLAPVTVSWLTDKNDPKKVNGYLVYDNGTERMVARFSQLGSRKTMSWFPDETKGYSLTHMVLTGDRLRVALFLKSKRDETIKHLLINPGTHNVSKAKRVPEEVLLSKEVPAAAHLNASSVMTSAPTRNLVFYSGADGSGIYAYNTMSQGNFLTPPLISLSKDEVVADMVVDKDDHFLYIALNSRSGSTSSIRQIDLTKDSYPVVHEWKGLRLPITAIALREDYPINN